jgi:PleD family two-component response regulator
MKVIPDDNAGRVVRERALRKICELLSESNKVTDIITQYGTT